MRLMFIGIVLLFLFLIGFGIQSVFADYYKTMGVYHKTNPTVCIMYPHQDATDLEMISNMTNSAIDEWQFKLVDATGGDWEMDRYEYAWPEHYDKYVSDYPSCSIFITFPYFTEGNSLGRTSYDFSSSVRSYFWLEIDLYTEERKVEIKLGDSFNTSTTSFKKVLREIPPTDIRNIILHEFGHGLGVEHYYVDTDCRYEYCDFTPIMFSHVETFIDKPKFVTEKDVDMVVRIYGEDGFDKPTPRYIPRICDVSGC